VKPNINSVVDESGIYWMVRWWVLVHSGPVNAHILGEIVQDIIHLRVIRLHAE
jgi:hypothetical protein